MTHGDGDGDADGIAEAVAEVTDGGVPAPSAQDPDSPSGAGPGPAARRPGGRARRWFRRQPRWSRRTLLVVAALLTAVATFAGAVGAALFAEGSGRPSATARASGHDALWLGHSWVGWEPGAGKADKTDADFVALVAQVRDSGIKDLFVHAGPFGYDGALDPAKSPRAEWFAAAVHRELPGVRVQAWLGQVVGGGGLHLESAATRGRVLAGVTATLARGFDGVHFDFEPVADGDRDFLALLTATRQVTASRGAVLSVSVPQVEPTPGWQAPGDFLAGHDKWWTAGYLAAVARSADQIAVMAYDTALPTEWSYRGYVARQTEVARAAVPKGVGLLIGVPAFHDDGPGHHASAETVAAAVRGVRLGMGSGGGDRAFGVALYVDFAATAGDWAAYRGGWLRPDG